VPDARVCWGENTGFPTTCDATAKLKNALQAAAVDAGPAGTGYGGDGGVTTDGRSIAILSDNIEIKHDQYLTCDGPPGVTRGQDSGSEPPGQPYYELPHSIVLHSDDTSSYTIIRDQNTRYYGCIERPDWYYPHDTTVGGFNIPALTVRDTVNIVRQFRGTATSCTAKACNMDNMFIIGFDTSDDTSGANKAIIKDVVEGGLVNEWLHNNGAGTKLQNFIGGPWLESGFDQAVTFDLWNIKNVQQAGTDGVKVTINMADHDPDNIPAVDDTVLVSGLGQGTIAPVSGNGRWIVGSVS
jgi:hypothetical protein